MGSLVSIIVPCYNLEQYILSCMESIAKLKYKPLEVIIVDDGSKDKSFSIVSNFIKNNNAGGAELSVNSSRKRWSGCCEKYGFINC